ncbi:MAG: MurR/RpiR family transcriptional regulator [Lachnospiraceae bacterium]|nr:MurR/RpiR family transcriptional regulator [Lachnospiraceae bacterium]
MDNTMKTKQDDVLIRIHDGYPKMSKGQKLLADYITDHYDKAVYLTAAKLGTVVGVSESTVVRFAGELGYDGYPGLQRALEDMIRIRLTALQRMEVTRSRMDEDHIVSSILQADIENIKETLDVVEESTFKEAVDTILRAKSVYILGVRSSAPLASFLGYYMNLVFDNVKLIHTNSISETFEQMLSIGPADVLIGISFPRYSKRTVKAMDFAKARGASVIAITDSDQSPIATSAECVLKAHSNMISFVDSMVGPLSLLNALVVALSMNRQAEVKKNLESLERIWQEYDVYESAGEESKTFGKLLS